MTPPKGPLSAQLHPACLPLRSWEPGEGEVREDPTPRGQGLGMHSQQDSREEKQLSQALQVSKSAGRRKYYKGEGWESGSRTRATPGPGGLGGLGVPPAQKHPGSLSTLARQDGKPDCPPPGLAPTQRLPQPLPPQATSFLRQGCIGWPLGISVPQQPPDLPMTSITARTALSPKPRNADQGSPEEHSGP